MSTGLYGFNDQLGGIMKKEEALEQLIKSCHNLTVNMNDTFHYACSDNSEIPAEDALDLVEYIQIFGFDALLAYEAIKRGYDPEIKDYISKEFLEVKQILMDKMTLDENFLCELNFLKKKEASEIKEFGGVLSFKFVPPSWFEKVIKRQKHYTCVCSAWGVTTKGYGKNMNEAQNNLKLKIKRG